MNSRQSSVASRQSQAADHRPLISVVLATRDRESLLADTLAALADQRWPAERYEILVADNGSADDTRSVVRRAAARSASPPIRYRYVARPGKSHAVNAVLHDVRGA